jgi:membrane protease YdiL (CAAX protease family)
MSGMLFLRKLHLPSLPLLISLGQAKPSRSFIKMLSVRLLPILFYSFLVCGFTFVLFKLTNPEMSEALRNAAEGQTQAARNIKIGYSSMIFFMLVALYEEVLFRLYLQSFFSYIFRRTTAGWIYALLVTSVIFAVGHFGILETWWVKFIQTFVIGIILGIAMRRHGMETSLAVHSILNIFALYSSAYLVRV